MRYPRVGQRVALAAGLLALLLVPWSAPARAQEAQPAKPAVASAQAAEEIAPGSKDARERTGVYVFLVWLWSVLIVLVFILRAKVKDVDRLHDMRYFQDGDKAPGG